MLKETIYDTEKLLEFIGKGGKEDFKVTPFSEVYGDITAKSISLVKIVDGTKFNIYTMFSKNEGAKENEEHLNSFISKSETLVQGILENYLK